jgi:anaerobic selenocysteine-containing dehydrogenase
MEAAFRAAGDAATADKFKGFDWQTEEDAFMDGYHQNASGGEFVTYERLRAMGTNGFQEPATGFENGQIVGTKRLFEDGKFSTEDGKAHFMQTAWRGLQAPGKDQEKQKYPFLVNNGRTNHVWQSAYLDQKNELVMDRWPYPFLQIHPDDMAEIGVHADDLVEVYNENGATQARSILRRPPNRKRPSCCSPIPRASRATWSRPVSTSSSSPITSRPGPTSESSPTRPPASGISPSSRRNTDSPDLRVASNDTAGPTYAGAASSSCQGEGSRNVEV